MTTSPKIYVAGHRGMVGAAIVRHLLAQGHPVSHIVTRTHAELDLTDQAAVRSFFAAEKPDQVYLAAAKVGGIYAKVAPAYSPRRIADSSRRSSPASLMPLSSVYPTYR